ncbi:hypothetical protein AWZ03_005845 [Drosophila navojoa]|uniref:Uncharacterized protein n=1 Tax=Drosophila navojoa TaxID=7232 RepID=A0A484BIX9_DRONA|nr:uncharacterized protein LOC108652686 [Drosophila navojoa]TDG47701.1 hypothetical protein AWZ03_005845 [Drosophila navojoa]
MPIDVITTDNLKYHRLVASKDTKTSDRWQKLFSWYPGRQNIEFSRIAQIYCESQHRYGQDIFLKYARERRLNKLHAYNHLDSLKELEKQDEQSHNVNSNAKVPPTTNGEYGRFKPSRMHYC